MRLTQHNQSATFDFSPYFGSHQIEEKAVSFANLLKKINSRPQAVALILKTLMDIDAVRVYMVHQLNSKEFMNETVPDFQHFFTPFLQDKKLLSNEILQARKTPASKLREAYEHSLSEEQFKKIRNYIGKDHETIKPLPVIHALIYSYMKDLETYLNNTPKKYKDFINTLSITTVIDSFDKLAFAMELSPVLIHGLPENKQNGIDITTKDWQISLKHLFDESIKAFETNHSKCPFSQIIRHIFATVLIQNKDGSISLSQETHGGALPVFITQLLKQKDALINTPEHD